MKKIKAILIVFALFIVTVAACTTSVNKNEVVDTNSSSQATNASIVLPAFSVQDASGNKINLQLLKGKKVFVNLWASWCPPCKAEMPSIAALYNKLDKNKIVFVLLSVDEKFQSSLDFMNKNNLNLPVYFPTQPLPDLFNTGGIPVTFIFNEKGELIKQNNGVEDYDTIEYLKLLQS